MAVDLSIPPWVEEYVRSWLERLHISHWEVRLRLALSVRDDSNVRALVDVQPDINFVSIVFRADIEDTAEWRQTIVHELLHVCHGRIDHYVRQALVPQVSESAQPLADVTYVQYMESYINAMAGTLYWVTRHRDYPAEYPQDAPEAAE